MLLGVESCGSQTINESMGLEGHDPISNFVMLLRAVSHQCRTKLGGESHSNLSYLQHPFHGGFLFRFCKVSAW